MHSTRLSIAEILESQQKSQTLKVCGWVRTFRNNQFVAINDGSCLQNLQLVIDESSCSSDEQKKLSAGAAVEAVGTLMSSVGRGQSVELHCRELKILGESDPEAYPLQPKKHSLEFLREISHLRFRTQTFGAVFRIRSTLAFAVHEYFRTRDFVYIHSPIITASDCEGAGQMFRVTTLEATKDAPTKIAEQDRFKEDFFGKPTFLTVSGQLEAELAAMGLSNVYTFGPTFRAENSNTSRHLAEFWMIEPEMAFCDLETNMDIAEGLLKHCIQAALDDHSEDLEFLESRLREEQSRLPVAERDEMVLREKLQFCAQQPFQRLTYTEAIEILKNSTPNRKKKFQFPVEDWGMDLQSEHERYLVEKHFKKPVILTDYPMAIKAFYMRANDDGKTVRAMDILFPGIGEMVGGSQREERLDFLQKRMREMNIPSDHMEWYLDTRRFGSNPHAGFGMGFERLVQFVTGMNNIRDAIPFPRYPKHCEF